MKIMVSACLLGENCKYNGGNNRNERLLQLLSGHTVIPVCPEVLGGLPTPRIPAEIQTQPEPIFRSLMAGRRKPSKDFCETAQNSRKGRNARVRGIRSAFP